MKKGISVIVPCYNSELSLPLLVERLKKVLDGLETLYELILVNDGSGDGTWSVIKSLVSTHKWIRGVNLMRNYGQHNALLVGIRLAKYDVAVTIDDDLQNPPEEIPSILDKLAEGYDVVYGSPKTEEHGFWRNLASRITKIALKSTMGVEIASKVSAFRVFRTHVRDSFSTYSNPFVSVDVLLSWGTTQFSSVPVKNRPREIGRSNYTFRKLLIHAMNMTTGFSVLPLQLAGYLGFAFTLFGIIIFCYVMIQYFIHGSVVPGFPFLAAIVSIFSGVQLFALGIIGEYLARMHFRIMDRPAYVVRQFIEFEGD